MADEQAGADQGETGRAAKNEKPICGVIMPISGDADYSADHWRRVQRILIRAIERAGMSARMVWESAEVDIIHARILQGIYESDVVIADVSGLNPNVMLELGLRLSTKRPTVVITDGIKKPPFDIGVFQYHSYQRDLEYNAVDNFIDEIAEKIQTIFAASKNGRYKSFVENFTFEVVEPTEVSVPAEEALRERMETFARQLGRIEQRLTPPRNSSTAQSRSLRFKAVLSANDQTSIVKEFMAHPFISKAVTDDSDFETVVDVTIAPSVPRAEYAELAKWVKAVIEQYESVPF